MTACPMCSYDAAAPITGRWVLTLDKRLSTVNDRTVNAPSVAWRYKRERIDWAWHVRAARLKVGAHLATKHKRRVMIERVYAGQCKEMDERNVDVKALVDVLVTEQLVVDDAPRWLELHVTQRRGDSNVTVVTVEELG